MPIEHLKQINIKNETVENEWVAMNLKLDEIIQPLKEGGEDQDEEF